MNKQFKKLPHTIYECKYHIVCCPKYRHRIFKEEIKEYTKSQVYILCRQKDLVEVLELNIQEDHIRLLLSIPPKYSVSSIMGFLKGKLALRLFQRYERIWELARPYLNTRKNDIHTEISFGFAQKLLMQEGGEEDIVIPAIILHDVGWKKVPEDIQMKAFGPNTTMPEWNRVHEVEGARIAGDILRKVDYPEDKTLEIQEIIKGHDSRKKPISHNDSLVKDADKLWRYSQIAVQINANRFVLTVEQGIERLRRNLDPWFLTESGKRMAEEEMEKRAEELLK